MSQAAGPSPVDYSIVKVRRIADPPAGLDMGDVWVAIRAFPPGLEPTFMASLWFHYDGRSEPHGPGLQLAPSKGGADGAGAQMRYANLFFDPQIGGTALLDRSPGWRRIDCLFTWPAADDAIAVRAVVEPPGGAETRIVAVGTLQPVHGIWQFAASSAAPVPFDMPAPDAGRLRPGFIGGAPKSGTTWMQLLLNQHPAILSLGEGSLVRNVGVRSSAAANRWFPPRTTQSLIDDFGSQALVVRLMQTFREFTGCQFVLDKSPGNARHYRQLLAYFPICQLIHCVRHPLDVLVSRLFHEANLLRGGAPTPRMADLIEAVRRLPPLLASGEPIPLDAAMWNLALRILMEYVELQSQAFEIMADRPGRLLMIRYEDMLADPEGCARQAFQHLRVPADPALIARCVAAVSFANLREARGGQAHSFFRAGTSGQYQGRFAAADAQRIMTFVNAGLPQFAQLGYGLGADPD